VESTRRENEVGGHARAKRAWAKCVGDS